MSRLVLASASAVRARLLREAGLDIAVEPASVDEGEIKAAFAAEHAPAADCATALAEAKAGRVSRRHPDALVIGSDQILVCDGAWFDKPESVEQARAHLLALRGRGHELVTAVAVIRNGETLWHAVETPVLTMREFTDAFLDAYVAREGAMLLQSVGAYRLEAGGIQLFRRIEGDYFSILGLPLLPLLGFLRGHGVVQS